MGNKIKQNRGTQDHRKNNYIVPNPYLQNKTLGPTPRSDNKNSDHAGPNRFVQNETKFNFWTSLGEPSCVNTNGQDDATEKVLEPKGYCIIIEIKERMHQNPPIPTSTLSACSSWCFTSQCSYDKWIRHCWLCILVREQTDAGWERWRALRRMVLRRLQRMSWVKGCLACLDATVSTFPQTFTNFLFWAIWWHCWSCTVLLFVWRKNGRVQPYFVFQ